MNNFTSLPEDSCPRCHKMVDAAAPVDGVVAVPKPKDLCVCIKCGGWNYYDENLKLKELTIDEASSLPENVIEQLQRATKMVERMIKEKNNYKLN